MFCVSQKSDHIQLLAGKGCSDTSSSLVHVAAPCCGCPWPARTPGAQARCLDCHVANYPNFYLLAASILSISGSVKSFISNLLSDALILSFLPSFSSFQRNKLQLFSLVLEPIAQKTGAYIRTRSDLPASCSLVGPCNALVYTNCIYKPLYP